MVKVRLFAVYPFYFVVSFNAKRVIRPSSWVCAPCGPRP